MKRKLLSFAVLAMTATVGNAQYCGGGPTSTIDSNLKLATLVGESSTISYTGCPGVTGVQNRLDQMADLTIGSGYSTTLRFGTCGGSYSWAGSAWIDFDGDNIYQTDERIAFATGAGEGPTVAHPFTVPLDAVEGTTRMRVMQRESGSLPLDPCATFSWGSAVEFTINLTSPCEDLVVTVSDYELCEGEMLTLDAEGVGAITWTGGAVDEVPFAPGVPGLYTFTPSSDDEADCATGPDDAVTVEVFGLPVVFAGAGDLVFCENENITLSAAGSADIYTWNDGDALDLMPGVGTYTFTLDGEVTEGGCIGALVSDEVTVEVVALPTITASVDEDVICTGLPVVFTGGGGVTYTWDSGVVNGMPYTPAGIGTATYTVWGTDANHCSNSATVDVEVVEPITLSAVVTDEIGGDDATIDLTVSGGASPYTYDWDNGETTEDLSGLDFGTYTVTVVGAGGCTATATYNVDSQLSIEDFEAGSLNIYPNPTVENINVELAGVFQYQLVAINGDVLFTGTATDREVLSLVNYASGVYFVSVKNENTTTTVKVVKK